MTAPNTGPPERRIDRRGWLGSEAEATRLLIAELDRLGHAEDEQLVADTVEGETSFFEAIEKALSQADERMALSEAIESRIKAMQDRKSREIAGAERIRDAVATALEASGVKLPLRLPTATLSLSVRQGKLHIDEAELPDEFFKTETVKKVDRPAVLEALEAGPVPGVTRGNSSRVLTIRR